MCLCFCDADGDALVVLMSTDVALFNNIAEYLDQGI